MADVSGVFPDEDHPPVPTCHNTGVSNGSKTSCETIKSGHPSDFIINDRQHTTHTSGPKDDVRPGTSSGYVCQTSFKREVVIW